MLKKEGFMQRLIEVMEQRGVTQYALAKAIGAKSNTVNNWFKGRAASPRPKYLFAIAEFLKVNPAYLLYGDAAYAPTLEGDCAQIAEELQTYISRHPQERDRIFAIVKTLTSEQSSAGKSKSTKKRERKSA
jgi:transcriptional regulator with XRE-family HTH domain